MGPRYGGAGGLLIASALPPMESGRARVRGLLRWRECRSDCRSNLLALIIRFDVGVSNHWYGILHTYNQPYWLVSDGTRGDQFDTVRQASNSWGCVGSGSCF